MGDAHTAQGNSEFDGTGIETSINGDLRLTLHKADSLPKQLQGLSFPLLENDNEYVVHGLTYPVRHRACSHAGHICWLGCFDASGRGKKSPRKHDQQSSG